MDRVLCEQDRTFNVSEMIVYSSEHAIITFQSCSVDAPAIGSNVYDEVWQYIFVGNQSCEDETRVFSKY